MLISLDYYRILTIPIKASKQQIERAYEDRLHQKPRCEYSTIAIEARQNLLQQAYEILCDPTERDKYDRKFLTKLQHEPASLVDKVVTTEQEKLSNLDSKTSGVNTEIEEESPTLSQEFPGTLVEAQEEQSEQNTESSSMYPTIEIPGHLLVGALIILHELAEYEQVIKLGNYYLNNSAYIDQIETGFSGQKWGFLNSISESNNLTSNDINCREDIVLAMALSYLELGREKWRIQDYEIAAVSAEIGLNLLQEEQRFYMVQEELKTDLYKLRPYRILDLLANSTAKSSQREQGLKLLKEMLEQRQGIEGKGEDYSGLKFDKFLSFIQQVRNYLTTTEQIELFETEANRASFVGTYLAMYALLAQGYATKQPELIFKAQEMLIFLSEGQEEVHWEQAVCALLLGQAKQAQNSIEQSQEKATVELIRQYSKDSPDLLPGLCFYAEKWLLREVLSQFGDLENFQVTLDEYFGDKKVQSYLEQISPVLTKPQNLPQIQSKQTVSDLKKPSSFTDWIPWPKNSQKLVTESRYVQGNPSSEIKLNSHIKSHNNTATIDKRQETLPTNNSSQQILPSKSPLGGNKPAKTRQKVPIRRHSNSSRLIKGSLLSLGLILGLGALGFILTSSILQLASNSGENSSESLENSILQTTETINGKVTEPPASLSQVESKPEIAQKPKILDSAIAKNLVETWLNSKSQALGDQHQIEQLNKILAPSQIGKWRSIALQDKQNNIYRQYEHQVNIRSVKFNENNANQGTIEAQVQEITKYYRKGQSNAFKSDSDNLVVRYQLIRNKDSWLIDKSEVLQSL